MTDVSRQIGFIFDLDGVIVDTAVLHYKAWRKLANSLGFDFSEAQNEELKGVGRMDSLNKILEWGGLKLTENEKAHGATQKNIWYNELITHLDRPDALPGAIEFLEQVNDHGILIGLGSASKNALPVLDRLGITDFFDVIVDGHALKHNKPHPEVFLKAAAGLDLDPHKCAVFEDSTVGIEAANKGGMTSIGIGSPDVLTEAEVVYPSLGEVSLEKVLSLVSQKSFNHIK